MKKNDKKGSHVGMMLSFVIFVTFLVFLYSIIEPIIKTGQDKKSILDSLETNILEKVSSDLIEITITTATASQNCITLNGFFDETEINSKIIVKNENEELLGFDISGDNLEINRNDVNNVFFKIYHAEEFSDLSEGPYSCNPRNYEIGFIKNKTYAFETKIDELIDEYDEDYEVLKEELKVPSRNDFGFSFIDNTGDINNAGDKEIAASVYVRKIPIYYLDDDANILLGFINIRVW